ncbi:slit homolog 1 protein [Antennarius striatus]|uniref:slit homolog 1 protein n=1 Tax=Antennarius striatus TaxID=241820 RepID=UPI0035B27A8A
MDLYCRGILWMILILFTLVHRTYNTVCPSSCQCHSQGAVRCIGYTITDIPKELPVHTYLLQLNDTRMNIINEQSLADKVLLLRFSLTHSHLRTIHPSAFRVAPQLKSVKLSSNDLSTLIAWVFSPLTLLEQLHLDGNQLEDISPNMFKGLVELLDLDLSQNKLGNLSSDVFQGLTKLRLLNLGRNSIKQLPLTIFHSLNELQKLLIYNNELQVIEAGMFDGLDNLEELKLHQNQITSLPPKVFWPLSNLKILTLSSNRLKAIPEKSFYYMPKLKKLTIYNNPLLLLPDQLMGHMPDITEFYLYSTDLTTVPGNLFANMSGLLNLNLHLNKRLSELPSDLFCCLPNLHKLSLKSNSLVYLHPELFSKLTTLSILLLNDNKLQCLPENIYRGLRKLLTMDLKNNHLKTLPGDIFLSNTILRSLSLSGNPWECTCSIRGIAKWIRHNEHVVFDRDNVRCRSPVYQFARTIGSLPEEEFDFCDAEEVKRYFRTGKENNFNEPTKASFRIQTNEKTSPGISATTPTITSATTKGASQRITTTTNDPARATVSILDMETQSASVQTPTTSLLDEVHISKTPLARYMPPVFYDKLVVEQRPEFVHYNRHNGWVYVWFLPSSKAMAGFLMFCHILLVTTGFFLILATIYGMYRLNKTMNGPQKASVNKAGTGKCDEVVVWIMLETFITGNCKTEEVGRTYIKTTTPTFCSLNHQPLREIMDLFMTLHVVLLLCALNVVVWTCPEGCKCQANKILCTGSSEFPVAVPSSTTELYLFNCSIDVIKPENVDAFSNTLRIFMIRNSPLRAVALGTFDSTANLDNLLFTDTELRDLPLPIFENLKKLRSLNLRNNLLSVLKSKWFSHLTVLESLDLSRNLFINVPEETFHPLAELKFLSLSGNNISQLPKETFKGLSNMTTLRLNLNSLQELPTGIFDDLIKLEEVSLHDNQITHLPNDLFSKNVLLRKLFLSHNRLKSLPQGIFLNLPLLSQISLYENQLESLGPGVFGPMNLRELWLYDNKLSRVEDDTFKNLTELHLLVLSRNLISHVSTRAFSGLDKLFEVSLHTNLLTTLQAGTFQGLPNLFHISLENNFINVIPLGFLQGVNDLGQLDLRNNSFPNLPLDSLNALNVVQEVRLEQNPWRCDKDILPLRDWLIQNPTKANVTAMVCETPSSLNGGMITMLTDLVLMPLSSTLEPVLDSTEKRKPNTPPVRLSTSLPAAKTTPTSEHEGVTSGDERDKETVHNDTSVILIVIAVVSTVIITAIIISCVCWRRNKRGRADIGSRTKNFVL